MTKPPMLDLGLKPPTQLDVEFVYVGDPMCSWCWGFSPVLEEMGTAYSDVVRTIRTNYFNHLVNTEHDLAPAPPLPA